MHKEYTDSDCKFIFPLDDTHIMCIQNDSISSINIDSILVNPENYDSTVVLLESPCPKTHLHDFHTKFTTQLDTNSFIFIDTSYRAYYYKNKSFVDLGQFPKIKIIKTLTNTSVVYSYNNALYYYDIKESIHKRIRLENTAISALLVLSNGCICYAIMDKYNTDIIIIDIEGKKQGEFVCNKSRTIVLEELEPCNIYIGLDSGSLHMYDYSAEIYSNLYDIPDDCPITHIVNVSKDVFITGNCRGAIHAWHKSCKYRPLLIMQDEGMIRDMLFISGVLICCFTSKFIVQELEIINNVHTRVYRRTQKIKNELFARLVLSS